MNVNNKTGIVYSSNTQPEPPTKLTESEGWTVRCKNTKNLSKLQENLTKLAEEDEDDLRQIVAENPFTPTEVLIKLTEDENYWVRTSATQNPVFLQHRAEQDGICEVGQQMPVEWLKQIYLTQQLC